MVKKTNCKEQTVWWHPQKNRIKFAGIYPAPKHNRAGRLPVKYIVAKGEQQTAETQAQPQSLGFNGYILQPLSCETCANLLRYH